MLCNSCIHKNVCKHTDHFKEYEKQYEEMRKKSSLFDKAIECPCYKEELSLGDEIYKLGVVRNSLIRYTEDNTYIIDNHDKQILKVIDEILAKTIENLKIN